MTMWFSWKEETKDQKEKAKKKKAGLKIEDEKKKCNLKKFQFD